jgi:hypothetical protein
MSGAPFVTLFPEMFDYDLRVANMDKAGVDIAIVSLTCPSAYWGGEARLAVCEDGAIPARTVIMAGTPAGTVFQGVPTKDRLIGALAWLLSGRKKPLIAHVIERHIKSARAAKAYLQPGDRVDIRVDRLGCLSNRIAASL